MNVAVCRETRAMSAHVLCITHNIDAMSAHCAIFMDITADFPQCTQYAKSLQGNYAVYATSKHHLRMTYAVSAMSARELHSWTIFPQGLH